MRDAAIDTNRQPRRSGANRSSSERPRGDLSSAAIAAQRLGGALDRPTGRARGSSRGAAPKRRWAAPAALRRIRPVKALTTVVFAAALIGILANAVLFQKSRHAGAPLDILHGTWASVPAAAPASPAAADRGSTGAVANPDDAGSGPAATASVPTAAAPPAADPAPAPPHRAASTKHADAKPNDPIGQLLGPVPPTGGKAAVKATATADAKPDAALLRTQRELKKLGYAVKPGGHMDGGTRQAIERFAHDHHLKAEAEITPDLRRRIAEASSAPAKAAAEPAPKVQ